MRDLQDLEKQLLVAPLVTLHDIKTTCYNDYDYPGVYIIYDNDKMLKVGKTSGKPSNERKENNLAGRLWGLTLADSPLREAKGIESLAKAEACSARCLRIAGFSTGA